MVIAQMASGPIPIQKNESQPINMMAGPVRIEIKNPEIHTALKVETKIPEISQLTCAQCGRVCKDKFGLIAHSRSHNS